MVELQQRKGGGAAAGAGEPSLDCGGFSYANQVVSGASYPHQDMPCTHALMLYLNTTAAVKLTGNPL